MTLRVEGMEKLRATIGQIAARLRTVRTSVDGGAASVSEGELALRIRDMLALAQVAPGRPVTDVRAGMMVRYDQQDKAFDVWHLVASVSEDDVRWLSKGKA